MTAVNISLTADAAYLFCDTKAGYDGFPLGSVVKCLPIPHLNMAIAVRGPVSALSMVMNATMVIEQGDDAAAQLPALVRGYFEVTSTDKSPEIKQDIDVFVIRHDGERPSAFMFFSHDLHGHQPWQAISIESVATPVLSAGDMERLRYFGPPIAAYEALKLQALRHSDIVGGFAQETIVDAHGIATRCLGELEGRPLFKSPPMPQTAPSLPAAFAKHLRGGAV